MNETVDILIVEDSKTQAEHLKYVLESSNYTSAHASNGIDALIFLQKRTPRIIISDILMPQMDGFTLCSNIKADAKTNHIPIILLTTLSDVEDIIKGLESGADSFITKPFDEEFLRSKVQYLMLNFELRQNKSSEMGLELLFGGKKHLINSDRLQILDLLISTYESAVIKNKELINSNAELQRSKNTLKEFNQNLEATIELRTRELKLLNEKLQEEIKERLLTEKKQNLIVKILSILNRPNEWKNLIRDIIIEIKEFIDIEAIAIHIQNGDNYPNWVVNGLPNEFIEAEMALPSFPFIRKPESFWTNKTSISLIASTVNNEQFDLLNLCKSNGYESLALIPVISGFQTVGFIQMTDKHSDCFSHDFISFFEEIASTIGIAYKRVQIEQKLKENEERYKKLFDEDLTGNYLKTPDGKILLCNDAFVSIFGFESVEAAIGTSMVDLYANINDRNMIIEQIKSKGKLRNFEIWMKSKNGLPIHIITNTIGKFNEQGELIEISGYAYNNTEHKQAQESILEERKLLRTLIDNLPDPIYVKDAEGRKLIANPADVKNIGAKSEADVIGKTDLELFPGEYGKQCYSNDRKIIETGLPMLKKEEHFEGQNGQLQWFLTSKIPLFNMQGEANGLVGISSNITQRKQYEQDLRIALDKAQIADRLKTNFLATMSHELRTPLNTVIGFSGLINEESTFKDVLGYIQIINTSGIHLLEIVENILDFSLIETGIVQFRKTKFSAFTLINDLFTKTKLDIEKFNKPNIEIIFNTENYDKNIFLNTDQRRVNQVLTLLINNAFKFSIEGNIEIGFTKTMENNKSMVKFFVKDSGIGIPPDKTEEIFEVFRQVDESNTRKFGGTGLGLAIAKKIVEILGGKIWVESILGKGSTFYFVIPSE